MGSFKLWLEQHSMIVGGIQFVLPPGDYDLILGDVSKVDASFAKDTGFYVGKEGSGAAIKGRYQNFKEFLKKNVPIEAPKVSVWQGNISFIDGRHRFAVFRDMGHDTLPFAVPKYQSDLFRRLFRA